MHPVNLIPMERQAAKQRRRNVRRWIGVCAGYALVLTVVSILCQTAWSHVDRSQTHQLQEVAQRIEHVNQTLATLKPQLAHVRLSLAIEKEIVSQPNWSILLAILGSTMGQEIVLRECQLVPVVPQGQSAPVGISLFAAADGTVKLGAQQYELKLRGLGRSQTAVSQFVLRLEETNLFTYVKLINTMREPVRDVDAFAFRIECVLGAALPATAAVSQGVTP